MISACYRVNILLAFLCFISISIYSGTKLFLIFNDPADVKVAYEDMVRNWSADLIRQIIEVPPKEQCPGNFSELFRFEWLGTQESCSCLESSPIENYPSLSRTVYKKLCNSTMMQAGCVPVDGSPARPLFLYNDRKLCVQRMGDTSFFFDVENMNEDGSCKEGLKRCGGKSNPNASICVNASHFDGGCPVMDISNQKIDESYFRIGNSNFFASKADYLEGPPLSEVKLSNTTTCYSTPLAITDPRVSSRTPKHSIDPCVFGGPNFEVFDEGTDLAGYLTTQGISYAADPSSTIDQAVKPFKRGYFSFKPSCRRELIHLNHHAALSLSSKRTLFLSGLSTFLISTSVIGLAILLLTLVVKPFSRVAIVIRYIAGHSVIVLNLVAVEMSYFVTSSTHSYFETLTQQNCGDRFTLPTFEKLALMTNLDVVFKRDMLVTLGSIILAANLLTLTGNFLKRRLTKAKPSTEAALGGTELTSIKAECQVSQTPK